MGKLHIIEHPLVQNKLSILRREDTGGKEFRELAREITALLCYEATRGVPVVRTDVKTPFGVAECSVIGGKKFAVIPILRAGAAMTDGILELMPTAKVGHIGLYRDPDTLIPVEYYCKLPNDIAERDVFLLDPALATGGTCSAAIDFLKDRGVKAITQICLICSPEGVNKVMADHPDVDIYSAAQDKGIDERGYILPGIGDAGDRMFGTK